MLRALLLMLALAVPAVAQEAAAPSTAPDAPTGGLTDPLVIDRSATGGAPTLEDILARQEALRIDDSARRADVTGGPAPEVGGELGARGGASDPHLWRGIRFDDTDATSANRGPAATTLIQDGGMVWLQFRNGPLKLWSAWFLGGTILALALFYLVRGRIRLHGAPTGRTVTRFKAVERFGHWLLAGSFLALAVTGLLVLFGRIAIIPLLGHEAFAPIAVASKWIHNNVSWAFMLALVLIFVMWVVHNIPRLEDLRWLLRGGGLFGGGHVPARKFNAGQKLIFWSVILGGVILSVTGVSLLFPFQLPMYAGLFDIVNATGLPQATGYGPLPVTLSPQEDMQLAQIIHAVVAIGLIAVALAHMYIGSVGMEGAYAAMGDGEVEERWAMEHHSIWAEEAIADRDRRRGAPDGTPAE
ncbi:MAG: formate dehydrogenase subunit gamma [Pseudomonadota bacterium]